MPLRPESSVSCDMNEYGELQFACDQPGPVRHYTPEQLGLARVIRDAPDRRPKLNNSASMAGFAYRSWGGEARRVHHARAQVKIRKVRRELPKHERLAKMVEMRRGGMSLRCIAATIGLSKETVRRLLADKAQEAAR